MTPERWQRVDEIFQAAIELKADERTAFVESACSGDEELWREVESLISADEQGLSVVEEPAFQVAAGLLATDEPELEEGQSIGHFEIVGLIGRGGMGEVYLAKDLLLNRRVALKLLPAEYTQNQDRLRRFQQEAQAASALNHPNILTIYELGQVNGQQFIATEFIEGETLRQRLKHATLNLPETIDIAIQIGSALAMAHNVGIIHRDIKPENIMLRRDGYVKVLDFGLAKLAGQDDPATAIGTAEKPDISSGLIMGTVKYMSPEQARGFSVDARSDIFSVGAVLYEMITGSAPFKGETASDLVRSLLNDEPPSLMEYLPDAHEDLKHIVGNALCKDKAKRYQTAEELLVALKNLRQQIEFGSEFQTQLWKSGGRPLPTEDQRLRRTSFIEYGVSQVRAHKAIRAAGLISLVILLGGGGYQLRKWISKRTVSAKELKITMLTTSGNVSFAAISPDAKYIAYDTYDTESKIHIRELSTNRDTQVIPTGDQGFWCPVFTADDKYIYYEYWAEDVRNPSSLAHAALYRRPMFGGSAEKIVDHLDGKITFSPDGKQFAFIRGDVGAGLGTLVIANVDGTEERSIITRQAPDYFPIAFGEGPSWSPDGKHIVYVAVNARDGYERIFELNLETNLEKPLTSQKWDYFIIEPTWLPDSSGILFIAANSSISNAIWRLSYPSGDLQRITNDTNNYSGLSVAGDSNTLITIQVTSYKELWIAPDSDASRARRIMPGRGDGAGVWTPDDKIVYARETNGNTDIWITNADGTNQRQLTSDVHQNVRPVVTSDGRNIVFQSNRTGTDHIWRMDIDGSNQTQLTFGAVERGPDCSPDSKWVIYNSWETGKATIWKIPIEGGTPQQITDVQCFLPLVSHNGKLIACGSDARLLIFPFDGGHPVATIELPKDAFPQVLGWTLNDQAIMYGKFADGIANFWIQPINGHPPKQLTFFKPNQLGAPTGIGRGGQSWSPDGKDLVYTHYDKKSDLVMMSAFK